MNDGGGLGRGVSAMDRPRANFLLAGREVGLEAEQSVSRLDETVEPGGFDLAIEAAGATEAVATAVHSLARGGTALLLGLAPTGSTLALPADLLVNNDLTLAASFGYTSAAWARVVALLNAGRFRPGRLVTHTFGLEEFEQAFSELAQPTGQRGKVLLEVAGG